jgi:probable rRNA maturation factor
MHGSSIPRSTGPLPVGSEASVTNPKGEGRLRSERRPGVPPAATLRSSRVEVSSELSPAPRGLSRLSRFCAQALRAAGCSSWSVAVRLCGDARMAAMNERYLHRRGPTDVLAFPGDGEEGARCVTGDIAISVDTLRRNASRFGVTENAEMKRLLVHGLLHLAGMDHGRGRGSRMRREEERILEGLASEVIYGGQKT